MKPYLLIAIFALACSPQARLNRLVKHHPELIQHDTLTVIDTVYFDRVEQHVTELLLPNDTLFIDRDRLHVKVVKLPGDSVYVQGICDTLTVIREIKVPCDTVQATKETKYVPWYYWLLAGIAVTLAFSVGRKV